MTGPVIVPAWNPQLLSPKSIVRGRASSGIVGFGPVAREGIPLIGGRIKLNRQNIQGSIALNWLQVLRKSRAQVAGKICNEDDEHHPLCVRDGNSYTTCCQKYAALTQETQWLCLRPPCVCRFWRIASHIATILNLARSTQTALSAPQCYFI